MKKLLLLALLALFLTSCGSSRKTTTSRTNKTKTHRTTSNKASKIVTHAKKFEGTKYKFGGTTKKGMDCSGLVYISFASENIEMPRVSRDMARKGTKITKKEATKGDLVFFRTNKNSRNINHVGIVVENKGELKFIHSSTSKGVIISSLENNYWKGAFVEVRRII